MYKAPEVYICHCAETFDDSLFQATDGNVRNVIAHDKRRVRRDTSVGTCHRRCGVVEQSRAKLPINVRSQLSYL